MSIEQISDERKARLEKWTEKRVDQLQEVTERLFRYEDGNAAYDKAVKNKKKRPAYYMDWEIERARERALLDYALDEHRLLLKRYEDKGDQSMIVRQKEHLEAVELRHKLEIHKYAEQERDIVFLKGLRGADEGTVSAEVQNKQNEADNIESQIGQFSEGAHRLALWILGKEAGRVKSKYQDKLREVSSQRERMFRLGILGNDEA